jgi:molybdate transport system permease protein
MASPFQTRVPELMDWTALGVSLRLGGLTVLLLLPVGVAFGRLLAFRRFPGRTLMEAALALPLVLPPTVLGFYLLVAFGANSPVGRLLEGAFGRGLVFSFEGLLLASVIVNLPFAVQPMQRSFEAIPSEVREAAAVSGLSPWQVLLRVDLPLAWPGIVTGLVLAFAHTLGEFGVVLMVGGSIPGETRTIAIAIYDRTQAFDEAGAAVMSAFLLALSLAALGLTYALSGLVGRRYG